MDNEKANIELRGAITNAAEAYELIAPGEMIGDFVVVCYVYPNEHQDPGMSSYIQLYGQDTIPTHVVKGLLWEGLYSIEEEDI